MDGVPASEVRDELKANALRREALQATVAAADEPPPLLHPEMARIRTKVTELARALQQPGRRVEAHDAQRELDMTRTAVEQLDAMLLLRRQQLRRM
jgi:hypothetical protein